MMRQPKKPKSYGFCMFHPETPMRRRRGCQSHKWIFYCPLDDCEFEVKAA
jgi:hypothetical protein